MFYILKKLTNLAGEYKKNLIIAYIMSFFVATFEKIPIMMILFALAKILSHSITITDFWIILGVIIGSVIGAIIFRYILEMNESGVSYKIFARERLKLGDRLKKMSMSYFTKGNIGNLSTVVSTDIKLIEEIGMSALPVLTTCIATLVTSLIFLFIFNKTIGVIMLVTCLIVAIDFKNVEKVAKENSQSVQEKQKEVTDVVLEYIKGMQVIKAFHLVGEKQRRTNDRFKRLSQAQYKYEKKFIGHLVFVESVIAISIGIIIMYATIAMLQGNMTLPVLLMILIFSFEIYCPLSKFVTLSLDIRVTEACIKRYERVMNEEIMEDSKNTVTLENHNIEFENVQFSYEDEKVIDNVSFLVNENAMTALVGKSGSGKSTICNLIARFWDINQGKIKIGNVDIKEMSFEQLMDNIGIVFQTVYLFKDTVYNNIAFGKENATKEQVIEAAKKARCYDFIMKMENGFDTIVGEGGGTLSGGEKQRISIARAIIKDPPIILLDEATASVDLDNERYIQEAIDELIADKTLIIIAHKLATIKNADQILVLEDGRINQSGNHEELINVEGIYNELWKQHDVSKNWEIDR